MPPPSKISKSVRDAIRADYAAGVPSKEISDKYGVPYGNISAVWCRDIEHPRTRRNRLRMSTAAMMYIQGYTIQEISNHLDVSVQRTYQILEQSGEDFGEGGAPLKASGLTVDTSKYQPGRKTVTDELLFDLAAVVNEAILSGASPAEYACKHFKTSKPTVNRWMRFAKDKGFINDGRIIPRKLKTQKKRINKSHSLWEKHQWPNEPCCNPDTSEELCQACWEVAFAEFHHERT